MSFHHPSMDLDQTGDAVLIEALQSLNVQNSNEATTVEDMSSSNNYPTVNGANRDDSSNPTTNQASNSKDNTSMARTINTMTTTVLDPIYIPTASGNDTWALTWPIWHMLPHNERKDIANQNGFKTIGEFEESVILSRALNDNSDHNQRQQQNQQISYIANSTIQPYSSDQLYELENRPENYGLPILTERSDIITSENNSVGNVNDGGSDISDDENEYNMNLAMLLNQKEKSQLKTPEIDCKQGNADEIENGGLILLLPNELIVHFILPFLPIEQYATCALVSPHWKNFTRTESVYKQLCERCYLQQSKRKTLQIKRFNNSYHTMLSSRYRVKTGCGFYVLKCTKIKKIQRDMWTEIPVGAILESTYYRYIYFFEDGTLLYALTSKPPHEMIPIFIQMREEDSHTHPSISAVLGKYEIQKDKVTVNVKHPWHHVRLILRVMVDGCVGSIGRFWSMEFEKHWSSKSGDFDEYWSRDLVEYKVPDEPHFRFLRDWRL